MVAQVSPSPPQGTTTICVCIQPTSRLAISQSVLNLLEQKSLVSPYPTFKAFKDAARDRIRKRKANLDERQSTENWIVEQKLPPIQQVMSDDLHIYHMLII